MLKKLIVAACVVGLLGTGVGTGAFLVRAARAQDAPPARATRQAAKPAAPPKNPGPGDRSAAQGAHRSGPPSALDAQRAYYEEGRITIDRFIAGQRGPRRVELLAARSDGERMAIRRRHRGSLEEIESREKAELEIGRGTDGRRRRGPSGSRAGRIRHEDQREGGCREGIPPPPPGRARAEGRAAPEGARRGRSQESARVGSRTKPAIRRYGRRIDSLTSRWNSSRSLSWPEGKTWVIMTPITSSLGSTQKSV